MLREVRKPENYHMEDMKMMGFFNTPGGNHGNLHGNSGKY